MEVAPPPVNNAHHQHHGAQQPQQAANPGHTLDDLFRHNPHAAISFLRFVMCFGCVSGFLITAPTSAFLYYHWDECVNCDRPLRYWVLFQIVLHIIHFPLRIVIYSHLHHMPIQDRDACVARLIALSRSGVWDVNRSLGLVVYGWFVLGCIWVWQAEDCSQTAPGLFKLSTALVVVFLLRLGLTFLYFYHTFDIASIREAVIGKGRRGATSEMINAIGAFVFKVGMIDQEYATCSICLSDFEEGEELRRMPCGQKHNFHKSCIDKWLQKNKCCPLCLQDIDQSKKSQ